MRALVVAMLRAGELQRVLQNLLRERVSIRDLETILGGGRVEFSRQGNGAMPPNASRTRTSKRLSERGSLSITSKVPIEG